MRLRTFRPRKYSIEQLKVAVLESFSFTEVCRRVDICNVSPIKKIVKELGLDISHFREHANLKWNNKQLEIAVKESINITEVCRKLELYNSNGRAVKSQIQKLDLDTSHFNLLTMPYEEILVKNSNYGITRLKNRLIKDGFLQNKCRECKNEGWHNNQPLVLQLHHFNGNNRDHRLENLCLLCPNCHTQTKTYAGKNRIKEGNER